MSREAPSVVSITSPDDLRLESVAKFLGHQEPPEDVGALLQKLQALLHENISITVTVDGGIISQVAIGDRCSHTLHPPYPNERV